MTAKTSDWRPGPTVCRCCLSEGCYKDISTEYFWMGKREVYAEMLTETLNVAIAYSKSGPNSNSRLICEPCISRLRDAHEFKRQVVDCEKTFLQHLDPGSSSVQEVEMTLEEVKIERVKQEKKVSDDEDFDDRVDFVVNDDSDDDLDNEPLMKLATKVPKKEKEMDILDLLDNSQITVKRKSTASSSKAKEPPAKKAKKREIVIKPSASKASASKTGEKKKKEMNCPNARRNAEIIVRYSTVYPFRLPESRMVCVYCAEIFEEPSTFRAHMDSEHKKFSAKNAFTYCSERYIKADCTDIHCRICSEPCDTLEKIAIHLKVKHNKQINLDSQLGIQPFKPDKLLCAICDSKQFDLRQLSRHTLTHFTRFTCDACGKSYSTTSSLKVHIKYTHLSSERMCRKCKCTFTSAEDQKRHLHESTKCWHHVCNVCGQRFMSWSLKQTHLVDFHGAPKRQHICPVCAVEFADRKLCRQHFKLTHTSDVYICYCCGLKFETKKTLEEHQVTHTKEKLFPCTVCSKSFARKKNLIQHLWIHSEHKRFECKPCNKKFNQRVTWKHHMKAYHPELVNFETELQNNNVKLYVENLK